MITILKADASDKKIIIMTIFKCPVRIQIFVKFMKNFMITEEIQT